MFIEWSVGHMFIVLSVMSIIWMCEIHQWTKWINPAFMELTLLFFFSVYLKAL